jgi:hypothetical protein
MWKLSDYQLSIIMKLLKLLCLSLLCWPLFGQVIVSGQAVVGGHAILSTTASGGGITLVNHTVANNSSGANVTTSAINTTGATLLVMCASGFPGGFTTGAWAGDSLTNTWNYLTVQAPGFGDIKIQIAYAFNPTVSASQTFTGTNTSHLSIAVAAFNNTLTTSGVFDQQNGAVSNGATSLSTGSTGTLSVANEVLYTCWGTNTASITGLGVNNSFSIIDSSAQTQSTIADAYLIYNSTTATSATWSQTASDEMGVSIGTFEP